MEGCYFVFVCWERSEGVCSCWGNEPVEKQMKNIRELTDDGVRGCLKIRGRLTVERGDTPSLSTEGKEGYGCKWATIHVRGGVVEEDRCACSGQGEHQRLPF